MHDIVFYIHGVTPAREPAPHKSLYRALHRGVAARRAEWPTAFTGAEWGWNPGEQTSRGQELLAQAQNQLGHRVLPAVQAPKDFSLNPARLALNQLRDINFYGFSDMFYYTSKTGKEAIRAAICHQLLDYLREQVPENDPVRLTLVGHSAGCVIGLDLLFHLFHPSRAPYDTHCFVESEARTQSLELRQWAEDGRLRLRRLITLGNPLAAMAFRHTRVVEAIATGEKLDPAHYGLTPDEALPGPRWINIWDRDDPLAWPVEPLMDTSTGCVRDLYVNVSDWITKAHNAYWTSKAVHRAIADKW